MSTFTDCSGLHIVTDTPAAPLHSVVPEELTALPQWVLWKYVPDPSRPKPKKLPLCPRTLSPASSTNPSTWAGFEHALSALNDHAVDGIGFVFSTKDPYCGIDIDGCVSPIDGELNELAQSLLDRLDSYSEFSPSGTGIHVIVRACLPGRGRKSKVVEIYDRDRYFTVTGRPVGKARPLIAGRQHEVEALYAGLAAERRNPTHSGASHRSLTGPELPDDNVLDLIRASPRGRRFHTLFEGVWDVTHASRSEADLALVGILADFVGSNPGQLDRLFRRSKLYRPKWDEQRGAQTYGEMTINKALEQPK